MRAATRPFPTTRRGMIGESSEPFRRSKNGAERARVPVAKTAHGKGGRFVEGNPGGPGRPRRPIEREYLRALNEAVSLEEWAEVVRAAVAQAKKGDSKARDWLTQYLIGSNPPRLSDLY